ncbi:3-hydroxyisobutyrate dehydrogenase, mitochondrial [Grammomys surdaster]|uniref:3-hydroxyisobutyrate dehydrogenase, mitochondrial n=1 Tax=Grammomys surdaster TaxID=491861 RepID=UPI00109F023A|nr:3-hydroxyisobutyrate dehydrogenase, mitochondrial [Grammomys surdaster]
MALDAYQKYIFEARDLSLAFRFVLNFDILLEQFCFNLFSPNDPGVGAARSGNLTFMVGGVEDEFAAAQELLGCMGSNVVYCGAVGTGQSAKICNNLLLAISMIGTAEAMNLGIRSGLDPKLLAKILNMSSGRCWSSDTYNPVPGVMAGVPSSNNYQGGFGTTLMAKDLGLAQDSATSTKTPILLGSVAHQIYRMMCSKGYSKKDFSSVFQYLREEEPF